MTADKAGPFWIRKKIPLFLWQELIAKYWDDPIKILDDSAAKAVAELG